MLAIVLETSIEILKMIENVTENFVNGGTQIGSAPPSDLGTKVKTLKGTPVCPRAVCFTVGRMHAPIYLW